MNHSLKIMTKEGRPPDSRSRLRGIDQAAQEQHPISPISCECESYITKATSCNSRCGEALNEATSDRGDRLIATFKSGFSEFETTIDQIKFKHSLNPFIYITTLA